jgi:hypothetical protein
MQFVSLLLQVKAVYHQVQSHRLNMCHHVDRCNPVFFSLGLLSCCILGLFWRPLEADANKRGQKDDGAEEGKKPAVRLVHEEPSDGAQSNFTLPKRTNTKMVRTMLAISAVVFRARGIMHRCFFVYYLQPAYGTKYSFPWYKIAT